MKTWFYDVFDWAGNSDISENYTITIDTINSDVAITYPTNTSYTSTQSILNYTYSEENCDSVWYSLDLGVTNSSRQDCGLNWTGLSSLSSSEGSNTWTVYINDSAGNENSSSVTFLVATTPPTCVLLERSITDIKENSTGIYEVIANCSSPYELNGSSALSMYTIEGVLSPGIPNYWSIRPPENDKAESNFYFSGEQIFVADGRADNRWYDNYYIDGDKLFDDNFTYSVQDNSSIYFSITEENSTQFILNFSRNVETTFRNIIYLRRGNLEREYKAEQNYEIYDNNPILIKIWNLDAEREHKNYTINIFRNINYSGNPNKNLNAYICNSSYIFNGGTSPKDDLDNCVLINSLDKTELDNIYYSSKNSTYSKGVFSSINGILGGVYLTNYTYLYYESNTQYGAGFYNLRFANGSSGTNVSFLESNVSWSSTDGGVNFVDNPFTPDIWFSGIAEGDELNFGINIQDIYGNNFTNFSFIHDDIGDVNHPITNPTILFLNSSINTKDDDLNKIHKGLMQILVGVSKDPDSVGNVTHNLTLHNPDGSLNYTINASFLSADDSDVWKDFDTSLVADGTYKINVTAYSGDNFNDIKSFMQEDNFTIDNTNPSATTNTPENNTYSNSDQNYTANLTDNLGIKNSTLYIYNETGIENQTTTNAGNSDISENYTITIDTINPNLNLTYPLNISYSTSVSRINYTYSEENCDSVWYSLDLGVTNSSRQDCGLNWTGLSSSEGSNTWTVYINDSAGNENSSSVTFTSIATAPNVILLNPPNNAYDGDTILEFQYYVTSSTTISNCSIYFDNNVLQTTQSPITNGTINNYYVDFDSTSIYLKDNLNWFVNCTDINNKENSSDVWVVDTLEGGSGSSGGGGGGTYVELEVNELVCNQTYYYILNNEENLTSLVEKVNAYSESLLSRYYLGNVITNWQNVCSNKINRTLKPEFVCEKIFYYLIDENKTEEDLNILKSSINDEILFSDGLLAYYSDNYNSVCYGEGYSDAIPTRNTLSIIPIIFSGEINKCNETIGIDFFDYSLDFFKDGISVGNLSCESTDFWRYIVSIKRNESNNTKIVGIKIWHIFSILFLILSIYGIKVLRKVNKKLDGI